MENELEAHAAPEVSDISLMNMSLNVRGEKGVVGHTAACRGTGLAQIIATGSGLRQVNAGYYCLHSTLGDVHTS